MTFTELPEAASLASVRDQPPARPPVGLPFARRAPMTRRCSRSRPLPRRPPHRPRSTPRRWAAQLPLAQKDAALASAQTPFQKRVLVTDCLLRRAPSRRSNCVTRRIHAQAQRQHPHGSCIRRTHEGRHGSSLRSALIRSGHIVDGRAPGGDLRYGAGAAHSD